MERIQRALDIAKLQRAQAAAGAADEPRIEQLRPEVSPPPAPVRVEVVGYEQGAGTTAPAPKLVIDDGALRERRVIATDDASPAGHAYRMLRTQVLQRARANNLTTLGVISATNGEGKTLTAINLALGLSAEPNQSVALIDLDLRRPAIAATLGLAAPFGLESWFAGAQPAQRMCYGIAGNERLYVLPTLLPVPGSSEALAGPSTRRLLDSLKDHDHSRLLIVDLPPVLLSDDALVVAPLLDAVVLVVDERRTRREDVVRVVELLRDTRIIGTVLNRASESEQRAY
jgi:protein-tyrosine kinase